MNVYTYMYEYVDTFAYAGVAWWVWWRVAGGHEDAVHQVGASACVTLHPLNLSTPAETTHKGAMTHEKRGR